LHFISSLKLFSFFFYTLRFGAVHMFERLSDSRQNAYTKMQFSQKQQFTAMVYWWPIGSSMWAF